MSFIPDAGRLWHRLWSVRLALVSAALGALEVVFPMFSDAMPRGIFAGLSVLIAIAAAAARMIDQPALKK